MHLIPLFTLILVLSGCQSGRKDTSKSQELSVPAANDDYFQEIGQQAGLNFVHSIGDDDLTNIIDSSGGGTAFLDYDQDGFIDIYACSGTWLEGFSKSEKPAELPRITFTGIMVTAPLRM